MPITVPPLSGSTERGLLSRVALATAVAIALIAIAGGVVGAQLSAMRAVDGVERRASLTAVMLAARVSAAPSSERGALALRTEERVARSFITLVGPDGVPVPGAPTSPLDAHDPFLRADHARDTETLRGEDFFVATEARAIDGARNVVIVALPVPSAEIPALLFELVSVLLAIGGLGIASALVVARDITNDVGAIERRALEMAAGESAALEPLPVRALDEVGELVEAFNRLQRRFADELEAHHRALARLEDAERRKEVLIATLRHELRTPLNSIIGFAEILLAGVDGELAPAQREDVEVIVRSGRHLLHLVDDVLDLSAIASGRFVIQVRPVDLVAIAREVVREASGAARVRQVRVELEGVPSAIVPGDAVSLRRAVTNLVQNAIEHGGGHVVVTVGHKGRMATVAVRDNGPGIAAKDLKRLFKPFERGRNSTSEMGASSASGRGAGLGLAITLALVELHQGTLGAESEVGHGSTFVATIPLQPTALAQAGFA